MPLSLNNSYLVSLGSYMCAYMCAYEFTCVCVLQEYFQTKGKPQMLESILYPPQWWHFRKGAIIFLPAHGFTPPSFNHGCKVSANLILRLYKIFLKFVLKKVSISVFESAYYNKSL